MPTHWHPSALFSSSRTTTTTHAPETPYTVLILNQPLNGNALDAILAEATYLVCADGGADRLLKERQARSRTAPPAPFPTPSTGLEPNKYSTGVADEHIDGEDYQASHHRLPDAIIGDLDSLTAETEAYYRARGVEVVREPDQYSTDFTKCLKWIRQKAKQEANVIDDGGQGVDVMDVVVLGGLGGRVDQGFSQIHHLFMAEEDSDLLNGKIYLLSEQSLSFVLRDDVNMIHIEPGSFAENVGIIPVLGKSYITTKGLEWDVENWPTEFGGQVSTSNHIRSDLVQISFRGPRPLFTMELEKQLSAG